MATKPTDRHIVECESFSVDIIPYGDGTSLRIMMSMTSEMIDQLLYTLANHPTFIEKQRELFPPRSMR